MKEMPSFENVPEKKDSDENKSTRREFIKKMAKGATAVVAANALGGFMPNESEAREKAFDNKEYQDLLQELINRDAPSRVVSELKARFGAKAFKSFKDKYNLSDEEAQERWSRAILHKRNIFFSKAENWKKVEKIAEDKGIKITDNSSYEAVNGQVVSIDGKAVPKTKTIINENASQEQKEKKKETRKGKSSVLESVDVDTSVY